VRILVIEDDAKVSGFISNGLRQSSHTVDIAANGKEGLFLATTETYDVLIVDRMLPGLDGLTIIKTLHGSGNTTPVLILSAMAEVDDRVSGLRAGGDDYLVKPFAFAELIARVEVLAKRGENNRAEESTLLSAGSLQLDLLSRKASLDGRTIDLQSREFRLLEFLLRHKDKVVTRTMLLEGVWDYHFDPQTNVIDVHISRLRKKLGEVSPKTIIETIRGAGYIIQSS
jgi:two-component system, OmpR family, response regulator